MTRKRRLLLPAMLIALPVAAAVLWMVSGRETLTKPRRNVQVEVVDEVFGDTITETLTFEGPVLGYFIGLDAVGGTAAACVVVGLGTWWWRRRRSRNTRAFPLATEGTSS